MSTELICDSCFITCLKEELLNMQLMRMKCVPRLGSPGMTLIQNVYRACRVDCKRAEFIGYKQTNKHTQTLSFIY